MGAHSQAISDVLLRLKCLFFQRLRVHAVCALAAAPPSRSTTSCLMRLHIGTIRRIYRVSTTLQVAVFLGLTRWHNGPISAAESARPG
jgi:hypothetical protein